jgi:hypothetical protein
MNAFHGFLDRHKKVWVTVMGVTAVFALFCGIIGVVNSDLFTVRVVEVVGLDSGSPEEMTTLRVHTPLDAQQILEIAQVPTDSTNLFSLRLDGIQKRLLAHPWIKEVTISKHFPQTVSLSVIFREPVAILQSNGGSLYYIDGDGTAFAPLNLKSNSDLPVLVGFSPEQVVTALRFLKSWAELVGLDPQSRVSSLELDSEKGLQVMATYSLPQSLGRVRVDLGRSFESDPEAQLGRLREVLTYLSKNKIRARQVFADLGKKIVVRIARSS